MSTGNLPRLVLPRTDEGKRICQVIKVRPESLEEYKRIHAAVWPEVLASLRRANVVDYSIHYFDEQNLLIAHMRYVGDNYAKDMAAIGADEHTRRWWKMTDGMQESFVEGATGSGSGPGWWTDTEEVFRLEG